MYMNKHREYLFGTCVKIKHKRRFAIQNSQIILLIPHFFLSRTSHCLTITQIKNSSHFARPVFMDLFCQQPTALPLLLIITLLLPK